MLRALVLRHHHEDRPGLIGEALEARGFALDVVMMDAISPTPSVEGYDLLVILGSKHAVYDPEVENTWFGRELEVIGDAHQRGIAIFGICFGAQALCRYHGGDVTPSPEPEIGWFQIEAHNNSGLASGPWFEYHYDVCTLPPGAELWATSARAVQAFAIGRNVGVQFHPEVDDVQLAEWFVVDDEDARTLGLDPVAILAQTKRETPAARIRAVELVDLVLGHIAKSPAPAASDAAST